MTDADAKAREIKRQIRTIREEPITAQSKYEIRRLYSELDNLQFKPDYMCLIIDKEKDYIRACRGFKINGVKYKRLLGTNGGIKNSTIVFVSERLYGELSDRIENGRDRNKELVVAKLEAYKALTCSASTPLSLPHGVLIVNDAETEFTSDIIYLTDENDGEPIMERRNDQQIKIDASDGFGVMLPSLAERWSAELGLDYTVGGLNCRAAWTKGMIFAFDFLDFAENVAGKYIVKDAWGDDVDVRNVELILTTSMVKLWDSYTSCADYIEQSLAHGYTFSAAKTCPEELENVRTTNYQFIQCLPLEDDDIDTLIKPTMDEIRDVLKSDWRRTVLFLRGNGVNADNVMDGSDDFIKAIMIDRRMLNDPYIQRTIYQMIRNRINEAKIGVLKVHGNYSIVSGDPYLLMQSVFGLEKTGLLKAGEIYNGYWAETDADTLACFRAPMTCINNIRLVKPVRRSDARYWYRFMPTATVMNGWDTATAALNGCDYDGDLVMLTDNDVIVSHVQPLPALMCVQRRAAKKIPSDEDFIISNIESFGNDIGQITNWATSMYEVRAGFAEGSKEYEALTYRIQCSQLYQQNAIDKAKGIVAKPEPRTWHDRHSVNLIEDEDTKAFYRSIVADRKPYFMRYIYPDLMKKYNAYVKNTTRNALREFDMTVDEMKETPYGELTDAQKDFLRYYEHKMPVGTNACVMNRICARFESEFDGYIGKTSTDMPFDYRIMRSDAVYSPKQFNAIKKLYDEYNKRLKSYAMFSDRERVDECEALKVMTIINDDFQRECVSICPDRDALCNIVLDICYAKNATRRFAWSMCGTDIIRNLLKQNGNVISFPVLDDDGDIEYGGNRFSIDSRIIEVDNDDRIE